MLREAGARTNTGSIHRITCRLKNLPDQCMLQPSIAPGPWAEKTQLQMLLPEKMVVSNYFPNSIYSK